jgi:hypothetical protein
VTYCVTAVSDLTGMNPTRERSDRNVTEGNGMGHFHEKGELFFVLAATGTCQMTEKI